MHLHRRQFVLGPEPVDAREDWRSAEIAPGLHLSHCPTLPVERSGTRLLIGIAVQTEPGRPDPGDELGADDTDRTAASWSGRWLLVTEAGVRTDAGGTMGCFYRTIEGRLWISSSPELLRTLPPELPKASPPLVYQLGMDWYPSPLSGIDGMRRLLQTQRLRLTGEVEPRPLVYSIPDRTYPEALDFLQERLLTEVENLARVHGDLWLPLSGGGDSRLLLALSQKLGIDLHTFTFVLPGMSVGDRELPPKVAAEAGYPHRFVEPEPDGEEDELLELIDTHTGHHMVDIARRSLAWRQWEKVTGRIELGGAAVAVGKYSYLSLPEDPPTPAATAEALLDYLPSVRPEGVRAWADWIHATDDPAYDWRDRFFIEQRSGAWLSCIGQALDLNTVSRVHVGNSEDYLAASYGLPDEVRHSWVHYEHLIKRLSPGLARYPINPPDSLRQRVSERVARERELLAKHGSMRTYVVERTRYWRSRRAVRRMA